jgi:hypothetical protein
MNFGNSSNCVHWSYATVAGTLTSIPFSMIAMRFSFAEFFVRTPLRGTATRCRNKHASDR